MEGRIMINYPKIPDPEFRERMLKFKEIMKKNTLDLVIIYSNLLDPSSVRYFSDVSPVNESAAIIIPLEGEPLLCSGQACHGWSEYKSKIREIRITPEVGEVAEVEYDIKNQYDFLDLLKEIKSKYSIKKIGIIGNTIFPYGIFKKIEIVFPDSEKTSADSLIYEIRKIKSENEINCMKTAGKIISNAFLYTIPRIKAGLTELEIQADLEYKILQLGAEDHGLSFSPMVPSGPVHTNLCMNRNSLRKVLESEIIVVAGGALYEGYNAVINTPVVLGKIPGEIKNAVKTGYEALNLVAGSLKPGISSKELYDIYTTLLEKKGYGKYSPYGSVHCIGMLECESPWLSVYRDIYLEENMTVAVDAYFEGLPWGSFRIEDTFVVRNTGAELLTDFNTKFFSENFL